MRTYQIKKANPGRRGHISLGSSHQRGKIWPDPIDEFLKVEVSGLEPESTAPTNL